MIRPQDVVLLPPEVRTLGEVRRYLGLDEVERQNPDHDVFAVAFKFPENPCAVVLRMPRGSLELPMLQLAVRPDTKIVVMRPGNET